MYVLLVYILQKQNNNYNVTIYNSERGELLLAYNITNESAEMTDTPNSLNTDSL